MGRLKKMARYWRETLANGGKFFLAENFFFWLRFFYGRIIVVVVLCMSVILFVSFHNYSEKWLLQIYFEIKNYLKSNSNR